MLLVKFVPLTVSLKLQKWSSVIFHTVYVHSIKSQPGSSQSSSFPWLFKIPQTLLHVPQAGWPGEISDTPRAIQLSTPYGDHAHRHMALSVDHMLSFGCDVLGSCVCVCTFSMLCWCWCSLSRSVGMATLMNFWMGGSRRRSGSFPASSAIMTVSYDLSYKVTGLTHLHILSVLLKDSKRQYDN